MATKAAEATRDEWATAMQGIVVDFANPPAWVVHVTFTEKRPKGGSERVIPVTWPFQTEEEARIAYGMAVGSGQFKRIHRGATKKLPEMVSQLVILGRREDFTGADDKPHFSYIGIDVPEDDPLASISAKEGMIRLALVGTGATLEMQPEATNG